MDTAADRISDTLSSIDDLASKSLNDAVQLLRSLQQPIGWWKGSLDTNVTMDAEYLLLREFLGLSVPETTESMARWIRSRQGVDGAWATSFEGPGDVSTTVEAWVALRLAGDSVDEPHMLRAAEFVRAHGGVENSRVFTRIWLSLFGLWSWEDCPELPPEIMFLPAWAPLNIYNWACWARLTIVPLTIVCTLKPVRQLPFGIDELRSGVPMRPQAKAWSTPGMFQRLDKALSWYARHPLGRLRRRAMKRATAWILARQEADGGWGGLQPPWVYSLIALNLLGYSPTDPVMRAGLAGLDGFLIYENTPDGPTCRLEACQSPVWDTALSVAALLDAGVPTDDPAVVRAAEWLLGEQTVVGGDWQVRRPAAPSGGWAFGFAMDTYPDNDDTAEVVSCLSRVAYPDEQRMTQALDRAVEWTVAMQSRDGGWAAFDADNDKKLATKMPFSDFGAVIDPPSADVTAHVVEMLATRHAHPEECQRGVEWLLSHQESDGSWFGNWGINYIYGTGAVVPALIAAGVEPDSVPIRSAIRWVKGCQNDDGGWGEDMRSYVDPAWVGRGVSTASQTAWALLALLAAGEDGEAVHRGITWLVKSQRHDGGWDEPQYTGTGFPGAFYMNYHLYRLVFPIWALGRYLAR